MDSAVNGHCESLIYSDLAAEPDLVGLVAQFVEELPDRLSRMEASLAEEDWKLLSRTAHQLKGAAGSYGFHALTPVLVELEKQARAQDEVEAIRAALEAVRLACSRVRAGGAGMPNA